MNDLDVLKPYSFTNKLELRNKVVLAPLDLATSRSNGVVSERDLNFHRSRSRHVGLDVVGSAYVSMSGNTLAGSISASQDSDVVGLRQLAETIHANGAKAILQIVHAGRMTNAESTRGQPIYAPSAISATHGHFPLPTKLTIAGIDAVMDEFIAATRRAYEAGFDGVELHGANTFLLQQFLSPLANQRGDEYGGNIYRRLRFATLLVSKLQKLINELDPNFILGYRLSPEEIEAGGMTTNDTLALGIILDTIGIDYLSLSLKSYAQKSTTTHQGVAFTDLFRGAVKCPIIVSGGVNDRTTLEDAGRQADLVGVASALLQDGNWMKKRVL